MIQIAIDEKACVSCTLCAEICPTDVFTFDEAEGLPRVEAPGECFGCLSCSEICPPACITHEGVERSETHYHDPYALRLAGRLAAGIADRYNAPDDAGRRQMALDDLGLRLRSVAEVFKQTLGGSLPAVGTMAGRTLARHLPRYRAPKDLADALEMTKRQFAPAWQLETALDGDELSVRVGDCFVRDVCRQQKLELGGELCVLFYQYLVGYLGQTAGVRLRQVEADRGWESCRYQVKVYHRN